MGSARRAAFSSLLYLANTYKTKCSCMYVLCICLHALVRACMYIVFKKTNNALTILPRVAATSVNFMDFEKALNTVD